MRDYGKSGRPTWTDFRGREWPVLLSVWSLKFKYPAHAALRAHIFNRDDFACQRCDAQAVDVPPDYDGRFTLLTNTRIRRGDPDLLVLDHILTRKAGGRNVVENLQTLCESCNKAKQREDIAAALVYRAAKVA